MWSFLLAACRPDAEETPDPPDCEAGAATVSLDVSAPHLRRSDRQVDLVLDRPAPAALLCQATDDPDDRFLLESPEEAESHAFRLQALRYGAAYTCSAGPTCPGPGGVGSVEVEVASGPVPEVIVTGDPGEGWLLTGIVGHGACAQGLNLVILDAQGRLRWELPVPTAAIDVEVLPYGDEGLLVGGRNGLPGPVAVDLWDGVPWAADLPGNDLFHHDAKPLPDGRVLVLSETVDRLGDQTWTGFVVRAFHPDTGEVDFDWRSQSLVDDGTLPAGVEDAYHANWVDLVDTPAGPKLYVSSCRRWEVWRVDGTTGRLDWRLGADGDLALVDVSGDPLPDDQLPQCQHGLEVGSDGSLLVYDNGVGRGVSRVVEYGIDDAALAATLRWEWTDGWFEFSLGDVDWLPNGHVLATKAHPECWSTSADPSAIAEVDPATGEVVWELGFVDPELAIYRSERVDGCRWFGHVGECPALEPRWTELAGRFGLSR
jgi:hypothetical protein